MNLIVTGGYNFLALKLKNLKKKMMSLTGVKDVNI